jgi:putative intracellular protease/amidase
MKNILILVTNHATLGDTDEANGTYAPELTHALHAFLDAGYSYEIASINGGKAPLYGEDAEGDDLNAAILANETFQSKISNTLVATELDANDFDAVFYPGGFGLLSDLAQNEGVAMLSATIYEKGAVVGAVCHGPAGLLPIKLSNGKYLLEDLEVTGFTREEEVDFGTIENIPYLLEESLTRKAAKYTKVKPWGVHIVEQDRVITGQNPASAAAVGKAMVAKLS